MAQVFARYTNAVGMHKPGDLDWVGGPQLELSKAYLEAVASDSEEAKAEVMKVMSNVPGIALAPMDGTPPHPFDIRNPFRVERGQLFVEWRDSQPARNVRWDFRERIMDIWEGRRGFNILERKQVLRSFLKYQWENGGSREAFVDYIEAVPDEQWHRDKIPGEIILYQRDFAAPMIEKPLADELRLWVADLRAYPSSVANRRHEDFMRDHVPGVRVCSYPWEIHIGSRNTYGLSDYRRGEPGGQVLGARFPRIDDSEWIERTVRGNLSQCSDLGLRMRFSNWTYESITPAEATNPLDFPNPRIYLLDGSMIPAPKENYRLDLKLNNRLRRIWSNSPLNLKVKEIHALLNYHFLNGGNPEALVGYIERTGPSSLKFSSGQSEPLFTEGLQKELAVWAVSARKRLGKVPRPGARAKASKPWPDLKSLALFHALRVEGGDTMADITKANAEGIANAAGYDKPSSGKELLGHFSLYTLGVNRQNERTGDGKAYTVKRRYEFVRKHLDAFPVAIPVADADLERLRNKATG